jgi:ABC-type Zn uptake system ZnuABC Zn-binding protein ZnuA
MVSNIADGFDAVDPDGAVAYETAAAEYIAEIRALDAEIEAELATIAVPRLVTNHDAFGYYIERYGLEFVGSVIPSFDSSAELSASALSDLVEAIEEQGVKAVFAESSLPGDAARTIAEEAGVTVVTGDDALYGDSLGPADSDAATYLTMMRHNTETIASNLR